MKGKLIARSLGVMLALVTILSVLALPSFAAAVPGTASIATPGAPATRTYLAGTTEARYDITVTNPLLAPGTGGLAPSVNAVRVIPPDFDYVPVLFTAPTGWTGRITSAGDVVFFTVDSPIVRNTSAVFTIRANLYRPAGDESRRWRVYTSDDNGDTLTEAAPATPGALDTSVRVLKVVGVDVVGPPVALDGDLTQQQTGQFRVTVENAGGATLLVSPILSSNRGTQESITCEAAKNIASQGQGSFLCDVTFGNPGTVTLTGDASSADPPADAFALNALPFSVLSKVALAFVGNSLQPADVRPGEPYGFSITLSKTGQVDATLDKANTTISFGPTGSEFSASLASPDNLPALNANVVFTFQTELVDLSIPDASYTPAVRVRGLDKNLATIDISPAIAPDTITLDRLGPDLDLEIDPPASQVQGAEDAASNGLEVGLSGTIEDRGQLCGSCPLISSVLVQYNALGQPIAGEDIQVQLTNNGGNLSGTYDQNYHADARFIALSVAAVDKALNPGAGLSLRVPVDNLPPQLGGGVTGGGNNDRTKVTVFVNEDGGFVAVPLAMLATDWSCDGHTVTDAQPDPSPLGFNQVLLTVNPQVGFNETFNCTYNPNDSNRAFDRVGLEMVTPALAAIGDGIIPQLPTIDQLGGLPKQDGQFFTNQVGAMVQVSSVVGGDTVSAYEDDGDDQIDAGDIFCGSGTTAPGGSNVTFDLTCLGSAERTLDLLFRTVDPSANVGPVRQETVTLDFTAPAISGFAVSATDTDDVDVNLSEPLTALRGRNSAIDWKVRTGNQGFSPASISGTGGTRTLNDCGFAPAATVTQVLYVYLGAQPNQRYADRAGNDMPDHTFTA